MPHNHNPNHLPRDVVEMQQRNPFGPPQSFESSQSNYTEHINELVDPNRYQTNGQFKKHSRFKRLAQRFRAK